MKSFDWNDGWFAIHVAMTAVMAWLAVILALPGDTFGSSLAFKAMASLGSEDNWAEVFAVTTIVSASGLSLRAPLIRLVTILFASTMHGIIALSFFVSHPFATGTGTYGIITLLGYALAWRRCREAI